MSGVGGKRQKDGVGGRYDGRWRTALISSFARFHNSRGWGTMRGSAWDLTTSEEKGEKYIRVENDVGTHLTLDPRWKSLR